MEGLRALRSPPVCALFPPLPPWLLFLSLLASDFESTIFISVYNQLKWNSFSHFKIQCKILSGFVVSKIIQHAKNVVLLTNECIYLA